MKYRTMKYHIIFIIRTYTVAHMVGVVHTYIAHSRKCSIEDTTGTQLAVLYRELSLNQR